MSEDIDSVVVVADLLECDLLLEMVINELDLFMAVYFIRFNFRTLIKLVFVPCPRGRRAFNVYLACCWFSREYLGIHYIDGAEEDVEVIWGRDWFFERDLFLGVGVYCMRPLPFKYIFVTLQSWPVEFGFEVLGREQRLTCRSRLWFLIYSLDTILWSCRWIKEHPSAEKIWFSSLESLDDGFHDDGSLDLNNSTQKCWHCNCI